MTKVKEVVEKNEKLIFSLEITPPDRGRSIDEIFRTIDNLMPFNPQFINVTYHQPHVAYEEKGDTIIRRPIRKKPGTVGICAAIKNKFHVETVPHMICGGFNKYETEDALIDFNYLGFENIFVVRGDPAPGHRNFVPEKDGYSNASELVKQIKEMNTGSYIDKIDNPAHTNFCIGVAGYPEKHFEAPNLEKDLFYLKQKVDNGADYVITQMFYSFDVFKNFVEKARGCGITVPIIPAIKPVTNKKQLDLVPKNFYVNLPKELVELIDNAKTQKQAFDGATRYMADLAYKLIEYGVPGLHIFTMGQGTSSRALLEILFGVSGR